MLFEMNRISRFSAFAMILALLLLCNVLVHAIPASNEVESETLKKGFQSESQCKEKCQNQFQGTFEIDGGDLYECKNMRKMGSKSEMEDWCKSKSVCNGFFPKSIGQHDWKCYIFDTFR